MTDPTTPAGENPWSRRPVVASAVVLAAIVVLGLVVVLSNAIGDDGPSTGDPTPSATRTPGPTSTSSAQASVCGLPGDEQTGTVAAPPDATWSLVGTTAVPTVRDAGPGKVEADGYRSCYAHTPVGALVSAANMVGLGSHAPVQQKFYERSTVPGSGRDALLAKPRAGAAEGSVRIQIEGFRVLRYTGEQADVDVAVRTSKGAIAGTVLNLQWSGGDWKIRVADDGSELSPTVQLPDLTGYVPWSGA